MALFDAAKSAAGTLGIAVAVAAAAITLGNSVVSRAEEAAHRVEARVTAVESASRAAEVQLRQDVATRLDRIEAKVDRLLDPQKGH